MLRAPILPSPLPLAASACLCALLASAALAETRLGSDVLPTQQLVRLRIDADQPTYTGSVRIELDVRRATPVVRLHAQDMAIERLVLTQGERKIAVRQATDDHGLLTLTADAPLAVGPAVLAIDFQQEFNTRAVSLYRMTAGGSGYVFAQFQPDEAREAFPCFDEPSFKIPYEIVLQVPEAHEAVSNAKAASARTEAGWKTVVFERTPPTSSYLITVATGPFEFTPIAGLSVPGRIVTVKGQSHLAKLAAEMTPPLLAACERYFGSPYPYAKLDLLAVPEYWAGAMENPGAITFKDNILLVDSEAASPGQRRTLARITAHELAHMWFGDLVTMAWWDDLWLNEAFADWMGDKITDEVYPRLETGLNQMQRVQDIMETDARPSTNPIRRKVEVAANALDEVQIDYNKGKSVLSMFEAWIGPATFRKGVNDYLTANAWKNARGSDFWSALAEASGQDVPAAMEGFIAQPGLPLIRVEPLGGNRVKLTQRRFANAGVTVAMQRWRIPLSLKVWDGMQVRTQQVLLADAEQTLTLDGVKRVVWVMPNQGARGYYRWSVPRDMLLAIAGSRDRLDTPERIALLGNVAALLDAGELPGDAYLQFLARFADDPEPQVISSLIDGLAKVRRSFVSDAMRGRFAPYVREVLGPAVKRFGLRRSADEGDAVGLVRPNLMAWMGLWGDEAATLDEGARLARAFLDDPKSIDPGLAGPALELAARRGDRALFDRYMKAIEATRVPAERLRLLSALGRFDDPAIEAEVLEFALAVRPNEVYLVTSGLAGKSDRAAELTFAWTMDRYDALKAKLPPLFLPYLVGSGGGCSIAKLDRARAFFLDPARKVEGVEREYAQVDDAVRDCVRLREREGARVAAYLERPLGAAR